MNQPSTLPTCAHRRRPITLYMLQIAAYLMDHQRRLSTLRHLIMPEEGVKIEFTAKGNKWTEDGSAPGEVMVNLRVSVWASV